MRKLSLTLMMAWLITCPISAAAEKATPTELDQRPGVTVSAPPVNDRCDGAIVLPCGNISISGTTEFANNDYFFSNPAAGCTGYAANGYDVVYRLNVGPGDSLWIDYQSRSDGSIYLITDCGNVQGSCVIGADVSNQFNTVESIRYKFITGGSYYLILDSYGAGTGAIWAAAGQLVCGASTPPPNDLCETAARINCGNFNLSGSAQFAFNNYRFSNAGISCTGQLAEGKDVVYKMTVSAGDSLWVDYTTTTNGSLYLVADCNDADTTCIAGADANGTGVMESLRHRFSFSGTYYLILDSRDLNTWGTWSATGGLVCINPPPGNDACEGAYTVACGPFSWSGNATYAANDYFFAPGASCTGYPTDGKDIVYRFNAMAGDSVHLTYESANADGAIYVVTDCSNLATSCLAGVDETVTGDPEFLRYVFPSSGTYYIILDAVDLGTGTTWTASGYFYTVFPRTTMLDNFNRPNGPVGASWVDETAAFNVNANSLVPVSGMGHIEWNDSVFGTNQEVFVKFGAITGSAAEHNLMLKTQGTTWSSGHIEVSYSAPTSQVFVYTFTAPSTWVLRGTIEGVTFVVGDQFGARAFSGGAVQVYKNCTLVGSVMVPDFGPLSGRIGVSVSGASASRFDDFGGGDIPAVIVGVDPVVDTGGISVSGAFPNPTSSGVALRLTLPRGQSVSMSVLDVQGREVWNAPARHYGAGHWSLAWDGRSRAGAASPGLYLAKIRVGTRLFLRRITVIR